MPDIFLDTLSYYKDESDEIASIEKTRVDNELDSKSDKLSEGSPMGVATLDNTGKLSPIERPIASSQDAIDGVSTDLMMTPATTNYVMTIESVPQSDKGIPDGIPTLDSNRKIPSVYIPDSGSVQSFYTPTLAEMLLLTNVFAGDRCLVHADPTPENNGEYIAIVDNPILESEWGDVPPHNAVVSVNGKVGVVTLSSLDIPEIADNAQEIATHTLSIAQNTTKGTTNASNIATNQGNISTLQTNETTQDGLISANTNGIDSLTTTFAAFGTGEQPVHAIKFNPIDVSTLTEGHIAYDTDTKTLVVKSDISGQTLNVGQESLRRVFNGTGSTITNGSVCRQVGVELGVPSVALGLAANFGTAIVTGVATHDIAAGTEGYVTIEGNVGDIPTNQGGETWAVGNTLFLSATTPGELTNVQPPISSVVGSLLTNNGTIGNIYAKPRSLNALPTIGGWMKEVVQSITPTATPATIDNFTDTSISAGISVDGLTGKYLFHHKGTYEIAVSLSMANLTAQNNGSVIGISFYNITQGIELFKYNIIVGRNDTVASGTMITQDDFASNDELVARYSLVSGNVGTNVSITNISFIVKSILIR